MIDRPVAVVEVFRDLILLQYTGHYAKPHIQTTIFIIIGTLFFFVAFCSACLTAPPLPWPQFVNVDSRGLDLLQRPAYYGDALMTACGLDGCSAVCFETACLVSTLTKGRGEGRPHYRMCVPMHCAKCSNDLCNSLYRKVFQ